MCIAADNLQVNLHGYHQQENRRAGETFTQRLQPAPAECQFIIRCGLTFSGTFKKALEKPVPETTGFFPVAFQIIKTNVPAPWPCFSSWEFREDRILNVADEGTRDCSKSLIKRVNFWDLPISPMIRTPCFYCRRNKVNPWSGI